MHIRKVYKYVYSEAAVLCINFTFHCEITLILWPVQHNGPSESKSDSAELSTLIFQTYVLCNLIWKVLKLTKNK